MTNKYYDAVYKSLYRHRPPLLRIDKETADNTIVVGLFRDCNPTEQLRLIATLYDNVICIGDRNPEVVGVKFYSDEPIISKLESRKSDKHYREPYAFNRINKMVQLRNYALDIVRDKYSDFARVLFIDLDLDIPPRSLELISSSEWKNCTGVVLTSMGILVKNYSNRTAKIKAESFGSVVYYDTSAYREIPDERYDAIHDNLNSRLHSILGGVVRDAIRVKSPFLKVASAFGGMASYPISVINYKYKLIRNPDENSNIEYECEHVGLNFDMLADGYDIIIDKRVLAFYHD